jgi:cell division protein FtsI/penicillin-binding protein 2
LTEGALPELDAEEATDRQQPPLGDLLLEAIGQGSIGVSPLQVARAFASLRSGGALPEVRLVDALQSPGGDWIDTASASEARSAVTRSTAMLILRALEQEPSGPSAMSASAATGAGGRRLNWFAGSSPEDRPGIVVVVVLENGTLGDARRIARQALIPLN